MSPTAMESHLVILDSVSFRQSKVEDRLTLATLASDFLSYYDSRLLADANTVSEGLLLYTACFKAKCFYISWNKTYSDTFSRRLSDGSYIGMWSSIFISLREQAKVVGFIYGTNSAVPRYVEGPKLHRSIPNTDRTPLFYCNVVFF